MKTENRCYVRIGQLRKEKKKTIAEISIDIGISASAISNYERGLRSPDADTLIKLSEYFDCTTDYLLGLSEFKNDKEESSFNESLEEINKNIEKLPAGILKIMLRSVNEIINANIALSNIRDPEYWCGFNDDLASILEYIRLVTETLKSTLGTVNESTPEDIFQLNSVLDRTEDAALSILEGLFDNLSWRILDNLKYDQQAVNALATKHYDILRTFNRED